VRDVFSFVLRIDLSKPDVWPYVSQFSQKGLQGRVDFT